MCFVCFYRVALASQFWVVFKIQKRKVNARRGKTLIWPVDWTHTHRGIVSPTQSKYIVGGWFSYLDTP